MGRFTLLKKINERFGCQTALWVSELVFGFRLDLCHDLLEFIGQLWLETGTQLGEGKRDITNIDRLRAEGASGACT